MIGGALNYSKGGFGKRVQHYHIRIVATNSVGNGKVAKVVSSTTQVPNCSYIGPYAYLSDACGITNWSGLDLQGAYLTAISSFAGVNLTNTNLEGAALPLDLTGVDLNGTNLANVTTTFGLVSGGVTGTPAALPTGFILLNGYLIGPGADLSGANLSGDDLSGVDLAGADLSGTDLTDVNLTGANLGGATYVATATLTGVIWSNTRCPDGTNSDSDGGTCTGNLA